MAHYKRKKPKRQVRCTMCTQHRWFGNHPERFGYQYHSQHQTAHHDETKEPKMS